MYFCGPHKTKEKCLQVVKRKPRRRSMRLLPDRIVNGRLFFSAYTCCYTTFKILYLLSTFRSNGKCRRSILLLPDRAVHGRLFFLAYARCSIMSRIQYLLSTFRPNGRWKTWNQEFSQNHQHQRYKVLMIRYYICSRNLQIFIFDLGWKWIRFWKCFGGWWQSVHRKVRWYWRSRMFCKESFSGSRRFDILFAGGQIYQVILLFWGGWI